MAELSAHRQRQAEHDVRLVHANALVFVTRAGKPQARRNVLRAVYVAGDEAGLNGEGRQRVGCHDLRHSFVSIALAAGLTLPEAAALARHASPRVTASVYAGLTDTARAGLGQNSPQPSESEHDVSSPPDPSGRPRKLAVVNWLSAYGFATDDTPARLGKPATLTVVLRDLDTDQRSYEFLAVEPAAPGDEQREAILRAMAGRFPDARWKTYNAEKQIASFVGRQHLYIAIYEEHDFEAALEERPALFAA